MQMVLYQCRSGITRRILHNTDKQIIIFLVLLLSFRQQKQPGRINSTNDLPSELFVAQLYFLSKRYLKTLDGTLFINFFSKSEPCDFNK